MFGEIHRKTVANAFWECELYDELLQNSISHMWSFTSKKREDGLSGTKDDAVEYIVKNRTSTTYNHICHQSCAAKGKFF